MEACGHSQAAGGGPERARPACLVTGYSRVGPAVPANLNVAGVSSTELGLGGPGRGQISHLAIETSQLTQRRPESFASSFVAWTK